MSPARFSLIVATAAFATSLSTGPSQAQSQCGMDSCPAGFANLFCRKLSEVRTKWSNSPLRGVTLQHHICVVNSGGVIGVGGDLTYYVRIRDLPDGSLVEVGANCVVTFNSGLAGNEAATFRTGGIALGPFKSSASLGKAEFYIVEPQLPNSLRRHFQFPFEGAVTTVCDLDFTSGIEKPKTPVQSNGTGLVGGIECRGPNGANVPC